MLRSLNEVGDIHVANGFASPHREQDGMWNCQVHLKETARFCSAKRSKSDTAQQLHGCALTLEDVMPLNLAKLPTASDKIRNAT